MDRFATDPPDVPVLDDVLMLLQLLVNTEQFYVSSTMPYLYTYIMGQYCDASLYHVSLWISLSIDASMYHCVLIV